jgi:hypothetical protein
MRQGFSKKAGIQPGWPGKIVAQQDGEKMVKLGFF